MEENVDIYNLFDHYNALYFRDELSCCVLKWSSDLPLNCTGTCHYDSGGFHWEIHLSEPLLKFWPTSELKNTLLHGMIHVFLWIKDKNDETSDHGSSFQEIRNSINSSSVMDNQRPRGGYNIRLHHKFEKDVSIHGLKEIKTYRFHHYMCDACGDWIKKSRYPSARDCIDKVDSDEFCGNLLCQWHTHKSLCTGSYIIAVPPKYEEKKMSLKDLEHDKVVLCATRELAKIKSVVEAMPDEEMDSEAEQEIQEDDRLERKQCQTKGTREDYSLPVIYDVNDDSEEINCEKSPAIAIITQRSIGASQKPNGTRKRSHGNKKRKQDGKWKKEVAIVGEWFSMYGEEEEDEDIIPLKNKRTERRKKLKSLLSSWKNAMVTSHGVDEDDDDDEECANQA